MQTIYFNPKPTSMEGLKKLYKKLCKTHHPDVGGTHEAMKVINAEYERLLNEIENGFSEEQKSKNLHNLNDGFREALSPIINLSNLKIEICGIFIWITPRDNDPLLHKLALQEAGFKWCNGKKKWMWHPQNYDFKNKRAWKMNKIYKIYGRDELENEEQKTLQPHRKVLVRA